MEQQVINILVTPLSRRHDRKTINILTAHSTPAQDVVSRIAERFAYGDSRLILTTNCNKDISSKPELPISQYVGDGENLLPIRLTVPLVGGKGGFGSQLRAAGGRMSSKKKKKQGEDNGSNRGLDGRRLRVGAEAKALAEYLALKPEMERKEKEARRKRWESVIENTEKKELEIKSGSSGRIDGKWVESKEEAGERVRDAVLAALKTGDYKDQNFVRSEAEKAQTAPEEASSKLSAREKGGSSTEAASKTQKSKPSKDFFGFGDSEFESEDEESDEDEGEDGASASDGSAVGSSSNENDDTKT